MPTCCRPYAVRDPQQLHQVGWRSRDDGGQSFRWREYEELRDRTDVFDAAVAESTRFVSSNRPSAGRGARLGQLLRSARSCRVHGTRLEGVTSVTSKVWCSAIRDGCGCSPTSRVATIPRELDINGRLFPVMGILRPEFTGLSDSPRDVWIPFSTYADARQSRSARRRSAAGRRDHRAPEAGDDGGAGAGGVDAVHGPRRAAYRRRPCRTSPSARRRTRCRWSWRPCSRRCSRRSASCSSPRARTCRT